MGKVGFFCKIADLRSDNKRGTFISDIFYTFTSLKDALKPKIFSHQNN